MIQLDQIIVEFRRALLRVFRTPWQSILIVVTLALAVGAVAVQFNIVRNAMWKAFPFEDSDRIVRVKRDVSLEGWRNSEFSFYDLKSMRESAAGFVSIGGVLTYALNFSFEDVPFRALGGVADREFFDVLGVKPALGRLFDLEDEMMDGAESVVLGYDIWRNRFGGKPDVIGKSIIVNGDVGVIIGVLPEYIQNFWKGYEVWVSYGGQSDRPVFGGSLNLYGKIGPDSTPVEVDAQLTQYVEDNARALDTKTRHTLISLIPLVEDRVGKTAIGFCYAMLAVSLLIFAIAIINVSNLLAGRMYAREGELSVRCALGASRMQILRECLAENFVLGLLGFPVAIFFYIIFLTFFKMNAASLGLPAWLEVETDLWFLGGFFFVICAIGVLSGMLPAIRISRRDDLNGALKSKAGRGSSEKRGLFSRFVLFLQIAACSLVLLMGGLIVKSAYKLNQVDLNFDEEQVLATRLGLPTSVYNSREKIYSFYQTLVANLRSRSEVEFAGLYGRFRWLQIGTTRVKLRSFEMEPGVNVNSLNERIGEGLFESLGVRLLEGREFSEFDQANASNSVIISQSLARMLFPSGEALGGRVTTASSTNFESGGQAEDSWMTVIGIAPDMKNGGIANQGRIRDLVMYNLFSTEQLSPFMSVAVRTPGTNPEFLRDVVMEEIKKIDSTLPVHNMATVQSFIEAALKSKTALSRLFVLLCGIAVLLVVQGLYSTLTLEVQRGRRDYAIKVALGATRKRLVWSVVGFLLPVVTIAYLVGLFLSSYFISILKRNLYYVSISDFDVHVAVCLVVFIMMFVAAFYPVMRLLRSNFAYELRG